MPPPPPPPPPLPLPSPAMLKVRRLLQWEGGTCSSRDHVHLCVRARCTCCYYAAACTSLLHAHRPHACTSLLYAHRAGRCATDAVAHAHTAVATKTAQLAGIDAAVDPAVVAATEEVTLAKAAKAEAMKVKVK
jgi:hypothetical protein